MARSGGLHVQLVTYVTFTSDCAVTGMATTLGDKLVEHHQDDSSWYGSRQLRSDLAGWVGELQGIPVT